jgi:predicted nucleic acid-binding Zn ribbon protein
MLVAKCTVCGYIKPITTDQANCNTKCDVCGKETIIIKEEDLDKV